jgi:D-alanyl-D-alanine carboxypeptidase
VRAISVLALSAAICLVAAPTTAQSNNQSSRQSSQQSSRPLALSAESVLLLDTQGRVLYAKNPGEDHAPASLVKLMTLYLACEALEAGRAQWEEPVLISQRAALTPRYRMGLRAGETVPLRTLLEGVAIASANDAATAVSEHLGGTEEAFVASMNAKAEELGLTHTHYANAHGLPDPGQRSTAEDLAKLIGRLLDDYPASRPLLGGATFVYRGRVYSRRIPLFQDPGGVQALKTGFTREAGYNLAVSAWKSGQQFLLIVLGAQTRSLSFRDAKTVLRYGFFETGLESAPEPAPRRPVRPAPPRRSNQRGSRAAVGPVAG